MYVNLASAKIMPLCYWSMSYKSCGKSYRSAMQNVFTIRVFNDYAYACFLGSVSAHEFDHIARDLSGFQ